jgi:predicted deacylase
MNCRTRTSLAVGPRAGAAALASLLACLLAGLLAACDSGREDPTPPAAPPSAGPRLPQPGTPAEDPAQSPPVPALAAPAPALPPAPATDALPPAAGTEAFSLLGRQVSPGSAVRLMWSPDRVFEGMSGETPVLVVHGREPGPVLCLTAAVHGDELNGIEIVRRVFQDLSPEALRGTAIGVPIVNIHGFRRGSRYLPDRRDLNRFFPGNPQGSSASRIAHSLTDTIIRHCSALVDLHTGSYFRTNLPQVRGDLDLEPVAALAHGFGGMLVLNSEAGEGTLRRAATDLGIPAVTLEAGEPLRLQPREVEQGVAGINRLLRSLGMIRKATLLRQPEPVYYRSRWVRADHGGVLFSVVRLGQTVRPGDILGTVTDPITNEQNLIYAPVEGRIIGMAVNQVVMPGFATFHLGTESRPGPTAPAGDDADIGKDREIDIDLNGAGNGRDSE